MSSRRGSALLLVIFAILLLSAIGLALGLTSVYESLASTNVRGARTTLYAADAALERAMLDLAPTPDWNQVLSGDATSGFVDGGSTGLRDLPGGGTVDLQALVNFANCGRETPCSLAAMNAITDERRWGENNPHWRLFAWGRLSDLVPSLDSRSDAYLVVLAGDDPAELDADPSRDGTRSGSGRGVLLLRASAFGHGGAVRTIEATVARSGRQPPEGGYPAQRGPAMPGDGAPPAVQKPGGTLERVEMPVGQGGMVRR